MACRGHARAATRPARRRANPLRVTRKQWKSSLITLIIKKKDKARLLSATGTERKAACIDQIREENR